MRKRNLDLFLKALTIINGYDGDGDLQITFTSDNVADGCEDFLNFRTYPKITCTFLRGSSGTVLFDCDEPLLLEDCPDCFYESIIKNATK